MKRIIAGIVCVLTVCTGSAQQFFVNLSDTTKSEFTPGVIKQRIAREHADTLPNLHIIADGKLAYDYQANAGQLIVTKSKKDYLLTVCYRVPLAPDSSYSALKLMRSRMTFGDTFTVVPDTAYLHEQLKGRVKKSEELLATWETLKKELSRSSNWDEYDVETVEKTAVLGWELTLAFLNGDTSLLPVLENYRRDIFLVNAGESSAIFADCEMLLSQNGYPQFSRYEQDYPPRPDYYNK